MPTTFTNLQDEVQVLVQDTSTELTQKIPIALNEALFSVADEMISSGGIPELKRIGVFTTVIDQAWTNLPSGFNGKLLFVGNDSTSLAVADGGVKQLMEDNPLLDSTGSVHTVALEGTILYYQGIPTEATTYPILYQINPTPWVDGGDLVEDYIPFHLQRSLFIHKAAADLWDKIEDGMEGEKVNTAVQLGLHEKYVTQMREHLARRRINSKRSVWRV